MSAQAAKMFRRIRRVSGKARPKRQASHHPVNSEQLELELTDARPKIPWGGRSPRSLTRCGKLFILSEPPTGGLIRIAPNQLLLFLKGKSHGS